MHGGPIPSAICMRAVPQRSWIAVVFGPSGWRLVQPGAYRIKYIIMITSEFAKAQWDHAEVVAQGHCGGVGGNVHCWWHCIKAKESAK